MIKSKKGKLKPSSVQFQQKQSDTQKKYDAVVNNFQCLFCRKEIHIVDIYESKCECGSQWFEKLKGLDTRRIDAV